MKVNHWITGYECGDCGGKVWLMRKETKVRPTRRTDGSYINCGDYDEIYTYQCNLCGAIATEVSFVSRETQMYTRTSCTEGVVNYKNPIIDGVDRRDPVFDLNQNKMEG